MVLFSMTLNDPNPYFKVTPLFNAEYLRNGTHETQLQCNNNKNLRFTQGCHFEWPTMTLTLSDLAKYSMRQSIARSLSDSWASSGI